jgi:hypothetical protein
MGLLLILLVLPSGAADPPEAIERIKAAFLYRFAGYVEWPVGAFVDTESPIVIGVTGSEAIATELARALPGRKVGTRGMRVARLESGERPADCCHILFVGRASERAGEVLARSEGQPVLTVTDVEGELPRGSVINFKVVEDRVRFDISREAAERNGLQLRSQLLAVARQVTAQ